jgi:hypothetical protein
VRGIVALFCQTATRHVAGADRLSSGHEGDLHPRCSSLLRLDESEPTVPHEL